MNGKGDGSGSLLDFPNLRRLPAGSLSRLGGVLIGLLVLILIISSVYTIRPEEVGIVLRLGRYLGPEHDAGPGLHFRIPIIDSVAKLPVQRQLKAEFGFRSQTVDVRSQFASVPDEASMLTGDLNAAVVEWVVQYRIVDPYRFLFRVRNVEDTFRDMSEAVVRRVIGDRTVHEVITVGRASIEDQVKLELQDLCDQYETGIRVDQVVLQSNTPPDPVKPSFNEVNQAEQERERMINEAQTRYNEVIPSAKGQAERAIQQARGYELERVNEAEGDAARFSQLFAEYRKAPEVTRKRMYLETIGDVMPRVGRKIIVDSDLEGVVPLLNLERTPTAAAAASRQSGGGG